MNIGSKASWRGAGKTTILNLVSGVLSPTAGQIYFKGQEIAFCRPDVVARRGIARTFQVVRLFRDLTAPWRTSWWGAKPGPGRGGYRARPCACPGPAIWKRGFWGRPWLAWTAWTWGPGPGELAGNLPFGEQRLSELARALAPRPSLLFLDEPASGLNDAERERFSGLLEEVRKQGKTLVLVERNDESFNPSR
ncbi:MAG: ATP-binding cassette domain-containing protein [Dehalococcoidia bacterium]|nr:ATP-binding cassette domain-containing protein [Dehalococcoidia bacterium]